MLQKHSLSIVFTKEYLPLPEKKNIKTQSLTKSAFASAESNYQMTLAHFPNICEIQFTVLPVLLEKPSLSVFCRDMAPL